MTEQHRQWQTIDMMPVIHDKVNVAIHASEKTYEHLTGYVNDPPQDLWNHEDCLRDHEGQVDELLQLKQQCDYWKQNTYLSAIQKIELHHRL
ncbi:MAG: hypothetical protein LRY67_00775 [Gammaproteobacteria bacterium]|nr:hypothetical protein [Gammaproteobacteria bacterium]MCD8542596.1 hypothetical protein [Gammaproteobacteria bacterium]